ncbi:MAG: sigma-70 family RNA polymerase sigma factor [Anaerolineae bacterium]|jgi:RNA polymerase sigma factor (sigma-70 family)
MCIVHPVDVEKPAVFACAQSGCRECVEALLQRHEGLVHYVLQRQKRGGVAYVDLAQEGRIGLWQAVLHFDAQRGLAFSTYAYAAIERRIWLVVARANRPQGMQALPEAVDARRIAEENLWRREVYSALTEALLRLPNRMRQLLVALYGLEGATPRNMVVIGQQWGMSRQAVRYWYHNALLLLRLPVFSARLRQLWGQDSRASYARSQALNRAWLRQRRGRGQ